MSLLDQMLEPDRLAVAYAKVEKRPGLWSPGVPLWQARSTSITSMQRLADELRQGGYLAHAPSTFAIAFAESPA